MHDLIIFFRFILKQQKTVYFFCKETVSILGKVGAMGHYLTNACFVIIWLNHFLRSYQFRKISFTDTVLNNLVY